MVNRTLDQKAALSQRELQRALCKGQMNAQMKPEGKKKK
jgi:hypothetical protein